MHGMRRTEHGLMSISGLRTDIWLENHLDEVPVIDYIEGMQIVVTGAHGTIVGGTPDISLDAPGTHLVYVDVDWRSGNEFSLHRYVFKIAN